MTLGLLLVELFSLALVVGAMTLTPNMSRPTVPLGVSVPSSRVKDPVVLDAVRRYQRWCLGSGVVALVGLVATWRWPMFGAAWTLLCVVAGMAAYVVCRRPILRAKAAGHWYDGVQVRVQADVRRQASPVHVLWPVHLFSVALAAAAVAAMAAAWRRLPDPFPVHYDAAGHPNRWAAKSWGAILGVPMVALLMALGLMLLCWSLARRHDPVLPDGDPVTARRSSLATSQALQRGVAWVSVATSLALGGTAVLQIGRVSDAVRAWLVWGTVAASLVPTAWLLWRASRIQRDRPIDAHGPESPDDDRLWKGGLFYSNPDDPRAFVPKRNGVGLDLNYANPRALLFLIVLLALPVVLVAIGLTSR